MDCGHSPLSIHGPLPAEASDLAGFLADEQQGHPDVLWLSWVLGDFTLGSCAYTSFSKWDQGSHPKGRFTVPVAFPRLHISYFYSPEREVNGHGVRFQV